MNDSEKYLKIAKTASNSLTGSPTNAPKEYADRQKQYLSDRTRLFSQQRAYLSCDYVNADVQGLKKDFYAYTNVNIRLSDVVNESPSSKQKDDYKQILFPDLFIDYFPIGAKIKTMGNTWLSINPSNMSDANAGGIIGRCNASYNSYDYYGNIVTEPIMVEKFLMMGNDNESPRNMVLMDGYFNVTCQKNKVTEQLGHNKRIILGTQAYAITGFSDFIQEFSGDRDSVHIIKFTARLDEVTNNDDMENFVANGEAKTFAVSVYAPNEISSGSAMRATATFLKDGVATAGNAENPVSFVWESSDESIFTVEDDGTIIAAGEGNAIVTARLAQNLELSASAQISITPALAKNRVEFTGVIPTAIPQYDTATVHAAYFEDGVETNDAIEWSLSGADGCYSYVVSLDGKSVSVTCLMATNEPLTIIAKYGAFSESINITLEGY